MREPTSQHFSKAALAMDQTLRLEGSKTPATIDQIIGQMGTLVERVMGEAGLYAPEHAAIAIKQSHGDSAEAAAILRGYARTLERRYTSETIDVVGMQVERRISSAFREIPGGQILGPTRDYTQRLLDEDISDDSPEFACWKRTTLLAELATHSPSNPSIVPYSNVVDLLKQQGLVRSANEFEDRTIQDIVKTPLSFPAPRSAALQSLARSETGAVMALGYSAMRGQGGDHPTIGELRVGWVLIRVTDRRGRSRCIGRIRVTESNNISKIKTRKKDPVPYMSIGYGLCFGQNETKAICMGILDRSMRIPGDGAPAISQEFVLYHVDGSDSHGFARSLTLPAYTEMATEIQDLQEAIERQKEKAKEHEEHRRVSLR